jgi:O-antigen/teichoic acid export membrane protein
MIRNLLSTTASRLIIAIINLGIVWISARYLGAEILGTISLIVLGISIIQLITAVLGGSSLVYQVSRHPLSELLVIAWLWIIIAGIPVWIILSLLSLIPDGFKLDVLLLAFLGSVITVNQNVFLGKEKVNMFNGMAILQSILVLVPLIYLVVYSGWLDTEAYVTSQYLSMVVCALVGTAINFPSLKEFFFPRIKVINEAFRFGGYLQTASVMQLFNYRLSYYLIEKFFDRATLGVFSLGVQISESVWIISKSMAVLLYSRLSNNRDKDYAINLTLNFIKITTIITILVIGIIVILPAQFFIFIFQNEFSNLSSVIGSLSTGILAMAISLMYSHYFSGTGNPVYNTISSGLGLLFTIILGFALIPSFGIIGAGLTASLSYMSSMIYQAIMFKRITGTKWSKYLPVKNDFNRLKYEFESLVKPSFESK